MVEGLRLTLPWTVCPFLWPSCPSMVSHTKPLQPPGLLAWTVGLLDWRSAVHTSSLLPFSLSTLLPLSTAFLPLYSLSPSLLSFSLSTLLFNLYSPSPSLFSFSLYSSSLPPPPPPPFSLSTLLSLSPSLHFFSLSTLILPRFLALCTSSPSPSHLHSHSLSPSLLLPLFLPLPPPPPPPTLLLPVFCSICTLLFSLYSPPLSFSLSTLLLPLYSSSPSLLFFSLFHSLSPSLLFSLTMLILTLFPQPQMFQGEEIVSVHRTCDLELSSSLTGIGLPFLRSKMKTQLFFSACWFVVFFLLIPPIHHQWCVYL